MISWKVRVRASLGIALLLLMVVALSVPPTAPAERGTLVGNIHRATTNGHLAFTLEAFNGASVAEILGPVLPYLRPGDTIDLGNDTKENQTNITLLNEWANELHERLPPGINITARVENLSNVQEASQNLSPLFEGITLDYEKNRTFIPNWTYNFSAAVNYFTKATTIVHSFDRTAIAYPTGIPLNQSFGWNYATLANITGFEDVQTQGYSIPTKWSPVITKLVAQFTNASVSLDRLTVQITLGAHKAHTPGNTQDAANATHDIDFASNDSIHSIYLWWGVSPENESILLQVLQNFRTPQWNVTLSESGLPLGTNWSVQLTNGPTISSNGSALSFFEPNGSYSFTATPTNPAFASIRGSFTVNGTDVSQTLTFALTTYPVSFAEQGLPSGATWYVNISGGSSYRSIGTTLNFREPNGTYDYRVATSDSEYAPANPTGSFVVNGTSINRTVTFDLAAFTVTFSETGLSLKTNWSVSIGPRTYNSSSSLLPFPEANGSYAYTVAGPADYQVAPASGIFSVEGSPTFVNVTFVKLHVVTIAESGLPIGTSWSATVNGTSEVSNSTSVIFMEVNGSYSYTIGSAAGYGPNPANGTLFVHGAPLSMSVSFLKTYLVTFSESTLSAGANWSVALTGASSDVILSTPPRGESPTLTRWSDGASVIRFYVSAGNYTYTASAASELNITGILVVTAPGPPSVAVPFPSGSSPSPGHGSSPSILPGLSNLDTAIIAGAVAVAVAVAVLVLITRRRGRAPSNSPGIPPDPPVADDVWDHP
ncbi:MAG: hypothetical protein WAN87_08395 [Thermoplasmata archaeon]